MSAELAVLESVVPQIGEAAVLLYPRRLPPVPWRDPHSVPPELLNKYIRDLEQSCALNPESAGWRTCLGMAYAMNYQVYKSMDALEEAIRLEPDHFFSQYKYAELHYRLRALIKAERESIKALELAGTPWEYSLGRQQLQEIRGLMRSGTQKPEWKSSLRMPFLALLALTLFLSLAVNWK